MIISNSLRSQLGLGLGLRSQLGKSTLEDSVSDYIVLGGGGGGAYHHGF